MYPLVRRSDLRGSFSPNTGTPKFAAKRIPALDDPSPSSQPEQSPIPDLSFLCTQFIHSIIEAGFALKSSGGSETPSDKTRLAKLAPGAARRKLFNSKARKILKQLDKNSTLARAVAAAGPLTTALYCALSTLEVIDSFDITQYSVGATSIGKQFLEYLAQGNAAKTLESLDLSSTFVLDADLLSLRHFGSLMKLYLNQCQLITKLGVQNILLACPQLHTLALNNVDIPTSAILETLAGAENTDPVPLLNELYFESDTWQNHIPAIRNFLTRRKHIAKIRIFNFVPKLDYGDPTLYQDILQKCSLQNLKLKLESLHLISLAPDLRSLQLQTATFGQEQADAISAACPRLNSLTLASTKLSMSPAVDFSVFPRLEELALADVQLGKIAALPQSLLSFTATIGIMATHSCADSVIGAICGCKNLKRLHLVTSQAESRTASFTQSAVRVVLEALKNLEDIAIDRELFGRDNLSKSESAMIYIGHKRLKNVKFICGFERGLHPVAACLPGLRVFESTDHVETILSLDAISRYSAGLSGLFLKFDRNILNKNDGVDAAVGRDDAPSEAISRSSRASARTRSRSFTDMAAVSRTTQSAPPQQLAKASSHSRRLGAISTSSEISSRMQRLKYLTHVSLSGATDMVVSSLTSFPYLTKIRLNNCDISSHILAEIMSICEHIREVILERCRGVDSLGSLASTRLSYLSIASCPDLNSKLVIDGSSLPSLEILSITNQPKLGAISVSHLNHLRWVTFRQCNAFSLRISGVPSLLDLALETVTVLQMRIEASNLLRLFLDCARTFVSEEVGGEIADVTVQINSPELRRLSWQADDNSLDEAIACLSKCPKLERLDLPSFSIEDVDPLREQLRSICPALKTVYCCDADADLLPSFAQLALARASIL